MKSFRTTFSLKNNPRINWFPGHMVRIYKELPEHMKKIDILLEVRDSRIPITSGNPELMKYITPNVKKLILFNKYDLCNKERTDTIIKNNFKNEETMILSAKTNTNVKKILERISKEKHTFKTIGIWGMVCGIPNVGKSTLINSLRGIGNTLSDNKATSVAKKGDLPTTTKHVNYFRVYDKPNIYIMDSPGVMPPKINRYNLDSFKLSACRNIKDILVEKNWVCDYILFNLNSQNQTKYVNVLKLKEPTDDINYLISHMINIQKKSENDCYDYIIKKFNEGDLGNVTLDEAEIKELTLVKDNNSYNK